MDNSNIYLYKRPQNYIPRVAAIHDMCGYGKCSLGIAIPVLSAAGCDVCPIPTAIFSSHTKYKVFAMHDMTQFLPEFLDAWQNCPVELDAIYSGFLGSSDQVDIIQRVYREHPLALRIVDPVMGDNGKMYTTYTSELCDAMRSLVDNADILTPNLTEASILTGIPYQGQDIDDSTIERYVNALLEMGAKNVVLKGITHHDSSCMSSIKTIDSLCMSTSTITNYVAGTNVELTGIRSQLLPFMLHGTGDLYAATLLAGIMTGKSLLDSAIFAADFVIHAMNITRTQPDYQLRGVSFESQLWRIGELTH